MNSPEVTLIELILRSFKRIKLVFAFSAVISVITYGLSFMIAPEFSYKGLLRIAQIVRKTTSEYGYNFEPKLLAEPTEIETFLKFRFNKKSSLIEGRNSYLHSIEIAKPPAPNVPIPPMIALFTRGPTLESAKGELDIVLSGLRNSFSSVLESHKASNLKRMELIKKELEGTKQDRNILLDPKSPVFRDTFTTFFMTGQFFGRQSSLELSQVEIEEIMDKSLNFDFMFLDSYPQSKSPIYPQKKNAALIAFILCFIFSFGAVFLREFYQFYKNPPNLKGA